MGTNPGDLRFKSKMQNKFTIIIPPQDIACHPDCLERFIQGDRKAFDWLYKNYSQKVFDYAMLMTGHAQLSEDLVHEVFIKLWINREKLKSVENFTGYLYRLYRNLIIDTLQRQKNEMIARQQYFSTELKHVVTPDELLINKVYQQSIEVAVSQLSSQQQLVFRLSREKGLKRREIASILKISPYTVKCHMQKAIRNLRFDIDVSK